MLEKTAAVNIADSGGKSSASRREIRQDLLLMALLWIAIYVLLRPLQNVPFQDDWIYGWRVRWLLEHHQLRTLEFSSNPNFVQVLWGALFCLPFGFSFTALRLSTGVWALAAFWGQYLLLRELKVNRTDTWIGTAVLAFNPIFFLLAFTFMTEAPFLCLSIWATYTAILALRRQSTPMLLLSIALSCLSLGVRVLGIVLLLATSYALFRHGGEWGRRRFRFAYPVIGPFLLALIIFLMYGRNLGRSVQLTHLVSLWRTLPSGVPYVAMCLGIWLLPLAVGSFERRRLVVASRFFLILGAALTIETLQHGPKSRPLPLFPDTFWALGELGLAERDLPGYTWPPEPVFWMCVAGIVAAASLSVLLAAVWQRRRDDADSLFLPFLAGQYFLMCFVWLIFDRYVLVLAPVAIALALSGGMLKRRALVACFVGTLAVAAIGGTRDHLVYTSAVWQGIGELHRLGARDTEIHAGYAPDLWLQRTHPETAPRGPDGRFLMPWYVPEDELAFRYELANAPRPGTSVLKIIPYRRWLGRSGSVYVLERKEPKPPK